MVSDVVEHATMYVNGFEDDETIFFVGAVITYTCDNGYKHTEGHLERKCLGAATWSGKAPKCEGTLNLHLLS